MLNAKDCIGATVATGSLMSDNPAVRNGVEVEPVAQYLALDFAPELELSCLEG